MNLLNSVNINGNNYHILNDQFSFYLECDGLSSGRYWIYSAKDLEFIYSNYHFIAIINGATEQEIKDIENQLLNF